MSESTPPKAKTTFKGSLSSLQSRAKTLAGLVSGKDRPPSSRDDAEVCYLESCARCASLTWIVLSSQADEAVSGTDDPEEMESGQALASPTSAVPSATPTGFACCSCIVLL